MSLDRQIEVIANALDVDVDLLRAHYGPPWHSDAQPLTWRWCPDLTDADGVDAVLDSIQQRGDLVEVWVWSDAHDGKTAYARIEGVRNAAMPLFFHQYQDGIHTYQRCLGPLQ